MTVEKEFQEFMKQLNEIKEEIEITKQELRKLKEEKFWNDVNEHFRTEELREIF